MKYLFLFLTIFFFHTASAVLITASVGLNIEPNGNWILTLDDITYHLERYELPQGRALKVYGLARGRSMAEGGNECFWMFNDKIGGCDLTSMSILFK